MEFYDNWHEEKQSAFLYGKMAQYEHQILHKKLFLDLKKAADEQAGLWAEKIKARQATVPAFKPTLKARFVVKLIPIFGTARLHPILSTMKIRGMSLFRHCHIEHQHTSIGTSNNVRAAIFGIHDGLISNVSLILGMVGANTSDQAVLVAGIAGLLAGAFSMGAGEYISVRSQREIFEHQIAIEKQELETYPLEEMKELSLIYEAKGIPTDEASKLAQIMIDNPDTALNTLAREELGINPEELVSPLSAMCYSFIAFAVGALIPLAPFLLPLSAHMQKILSISGTGLALFVIGAILSLFSNRNPIYLGARMLSIGALAGTITFFIGKLLESHL